MFITAAGEMRAVNPLADNPLRTRADFQAAVRDLFGPLEAYRSPGGARLTPGETQAHFPAVAADCEGFSRPLWGLVPLAAGGGAFDGWDRYREGLVNGTDPDHEEYWGPAEDFSQKHVEMAAIGLGLALAPEELWEPLDDTEREQVVAWLSQINDAGLHDCNWKFFRVLVNIGLREVGAEHDWELTQGTLDRLESFALSEGWYSDGPADEKPCGYYIPWAMQFYGLVYAAVVGDDDPERSARFRERAAEFATEFVHWFRADGAGLPYGRSLTYRFAQASFWGALAFADVEALPWGQVRGLWARNIRQWADQPIFTGDGVLSVGYVYPTLKTSEPYNSASSPYWAMKAFLPLALPAEHPFWQAEEEPLAATPATAGTVVQHHPKMVICRDEGAGHHYALTTGQNSQYQEKYTKIAYSTEFGFSVRSRALGLAGAGHDGALALSEGGTHYRIRLEIDESVVDDSGERPTLYSRWTPWSDVTVDTWVAPASPWHVRVHRLETGRPLHSGEGGFAISRAGDDAADACERVENAGEAVVRYPEGVGGVVDLLDDGANPRDGAAVDQGPNTNLVAPRTVVPTLTGEHDPGTHWLVAGVTAAAPGGDARWDSPPEIAVEDSVPTVRDRDGTTVLRCDDSAPGPLSGLAEVFDRS